MINFWSYVITKKLWWKTLAGLKLHPIIRSLDASNIYVVCPKSKCTDFPMDELVM